jgi:transcriptional regulator with XRE-family HTH domain
VILLRHALGEHLRARRLELGRTLREVSADAQVSLGYLSEIERGRKEASSELLGAICDALEVPLSQVLVGLAADIRAREGVRVEVVQAA